MIIITIRSLISVDPKQYKVVKVVKTRQRSLESIWRKVDDTPEGLKYTSDLLHLPQLLEDSRIVDVNNGPIEGNSFVVWVQCVPNIGDHVAHTFMVQFFKVD